MAGGFITVKGGATYFTELTEAQATTASLLTANSSTSPGDPDIFYVTAGTTTMTTEENQTIIVSNDSGSTTTLEAKFSGDILIGNNTNDMFVTSGYESIYGGDGSDTVTDTYNGPQFSTVWLGNGNDSVNMKGAAYVTAGGGNNNFTLGGPSLVTVGGGSDVVHFLKTDTALGGSFTEVGAGGNDTVYTLQGHYTANVQGNATLDGIAYVATISGGGVVNSDFRGPDMGVGLTVRNETIVANSGNVTVAGNTGIQMNAGSGNDSLIGQGFDTFVGGTGFATMQDGPTGNSFFVFNTNGGTDVIKHFHQGSDAIRLNGLSAASAFADSSYNAGTHTTTIIDGATTISVVGVQLNAGNFVNG